MDPVIVLGMHRSGTSMIARMLDKLGLFVGADVQGDHESLFFMRLNETIFQAAGASWDYPAKVASCLAEPHQVEEQAAQLGRLLKGPTIEQYLGATPETSAARAKRKRPWGWKDPRNSYTLPVWRRIFPEARIVHVARNGIDVAASLRRRHLDLTIPGYQRLTGQKPPQFGFFYLGEIRFTQRCATLEGGLSLWQEYMDAITMQQRQTPPEAWLNLRYEDVLADPDPAIDRLVAFCGLAPDSATKIAAATLGRKDNAYRFLQDDELLVFARSVLDQSLFGYEDDVRALVT